MRRPILLALACATAAAQVCTLTPLTPAEPLRIQEAELATDSDTFQAFQMALGPNDRVYFIDTVNRIRTIEADGRLRTIAGNGKPGNVQEGVALQSPMPAVTQVAVSPTGVVHFAAVDRIYRIEDGNIRAVAGSGKPGFNGEAAGLLELNLGNIVHFSFDATGRLYLVDGFLRVRRMEGSMLRTFAGSTIPYDPGAENGEGGSATAASFESPRQVVPLRDGAVWVRDQSNLHAIAPDGNIRILRRAWPPQGEILLTPEGTPVATVAPGFANQITATGENGPNVFAGFTGTPRAIGNNALYTIAPRIDLVTGLSRWQEGSSSLVAGAPRRTATSGTSADSFGVWIEQTSSLVYRGVVDGVFGLAEARSGQSPRLIAGRGTDNGDAEGKPLASISISGLIGFTADNEGRLILLDSARRRVLLIASDGVVSNLKDARQQPVTVTVASGSLNSAQRIAVDQAGNIYWGFFGGPSPTGPQGLVSVWTRSSAAVTNYLVDGLESIVRLSNGVVAGIAGPNALFRSLRRLEATRVGDVEAGLEMLGMQSAALSGDTPYFVYAPRLFQGRPGSLEAFTELTSPTEPDRTLVILFVVATNRGLVFRAADRAFYRIENPQSCGKEQQPKVADGGLRSAAGFGWPDTVSPWSLATIFGSRLGPIEGQGMTFDGLGRVTDQPAPYPTPRLGWRLSNGALAGFALPVLFANDSQITVQVPPALNGPELELFWSWNGLLIAHPKPIRMQTATPGIFVQGAGRDGAAAALNQDNSVNSPQRPAARGSVVQFFLTGLGGLEPPLPGLGTFNSTVTVQRAGASVAVLIGGQPAVVEFVRCEF